MTLIPQELYDQMLEHLPILCVDVVLVHQGKVLLTYRTQEPAKGQWWIQGGRVWKNETLTTAALRLAQREIGTAVKIIKKIGTYEYFSQKGPAGVRTGIHDVAVCFLVAAADEHFKIQLDPTHQKFRWIDRVEEGLDPYVKNVLSDAQIF